MTPIKRNPWKSVSDEACHSLIKNVTLIFSVSHSFSKSVSHGISIYLTKSLVPLQWRSFIEKCDTKIFIKMWHRDYFTHITENGPHETPYSLKVKTPNM